MSSQEQLAFQAVKYECVKFFEDGKISTPRRYRDHIHSLRTQGNRKDQSFVEYLAYLVGRASAYVGYC